ncbi:hypothetical protein AGOR_G00034800 [Albula goreensis]|uniref:Uncharacterized protein n=1 Tax=Albula goreensis TaxID=1534307 RepID=A0A8T3DWL1_9TELE|nr:hypothetical protein AGOR_G00034800 [Albula goreensis]
MSPYQLVCEYLIRCKDPKQLRRRVFDLSQRRAPDNVIKFYVRQKMVPPMPLACGNVKPDEQRPPVERELKIMPMWLQKSVPFIHKAVMDYNSPTLDGPPQMMTNTAPYTFPPGIRYPPELPKPSPYTLLASGACGRLQYFPTAPPRVKNV